MSDHRTSPDIWAAMLRIRCDRADIGPHDERGLVAMLSIWATVGSPLMHEWSIEIADFATDLRRDIHDDLQQGGWDLEREVLPAILSLLTWTADGPHRDGEPEDFMAELILAMHERSGTMPTSR